MTPETQQPAGVAEADLGAEGRELDLRRSGSRGSCRATRSAGRSRCSGARSARTAAPTSLTADFRPTTVRMSIRCSLVSVPIGIGTPPRSSLTTWTWSAIRQCAQLLAASSSRSSLLVTRISAWSSGTSRATRSETSGPIRPIFSVMASRRAAERDDVALLQRRVAGSAPSAVPSRARRLTMRYSGCACRKSRDGLADPGRRSRAGRRAGRRRSSPTGPARRRSRRRAPLSYSLRRRLGVDAPPSRQVFADQDDADGAPDVGDAVGQRDHAR